jgi:hypothetical protein
MRGRAADLALLLMVTGCGAASSVVPTASAPGASGSSAPPIATPLATASQSGEPTASPTPPLHIDGVAQVVTTDLVSRSAPGTGEDSEIYPGLLDAPTLLILIEGPVVADGYDWYLVAPFEEFLSDIAPEWPRLGWVAAASRADEPWIAPWAGDCPDPTLEAIHGRPYYLLLACFGRQTLTLAGTFGGCFASDPVSVSPSWLTSTGCHLVPFGWEPDGVFSGGLVLRLGGNVGVPYENGAAIRVIGHFDDEAARTCSENTPPGNEETPPELVILGCRAQFVVTDVSATQAP